VSRITGYNSGEKSHSAGGGHQLLIQHLAGNWVMKVGGGVKKKSEKRRAECRTRCFERALRFQKGRKNRGSGFSGWETN